MIEQKKLEKEIIAVTTGLHWRIAYVADKKIKGHF